MEGSVKPPQISEMFQKFALAFKTKTFEFFAEEEQTDTQDTDGFSLLDSPEEVITGQRVVVIKPDHVQDKNPKAAIQDNLHSLQISQNLIPSLFATISSFEASYLQLQTAQSPFDEHSIKAADRAAVSHLHILSEIKQLYRDFIKNPNPNHSFSNVTMSHLEAQVQENQNLLRSLETIVNRLQSDIDLKDAQVFMLRQKKEKIQKSNLNSSKRLSLSNSNHSSSSSFSSSSLLSFGAFDWVLKDTCKSAHSFTKVLIELMKKSGWDMEMAANSVHPNIDYAKKGHYRYVFLSYVCLEMFQGFDSENFCFEKEEIEHCNGKDSNIRRENSLRQFVEHGMGDPLELISKNPTCDFGRFCEKKYQKLIHPAMESSLFKRLDHNDVVLRSWRSSAGFYSSFLNMASSIWMLHKLAFSFNPIVEIFQVERGIDFSMVYMENVTRKTVPVSKVRPKVEFTVIPGFRIGRTVIQCQVYLSTMKSAE